MKLLDTTLRDGSYVIDFQFTKNETAELVKRLEQVGFEYIEVGHGVGLGACRNDLTPSLENDEAYMRAASASSKTSKVGVFCIPGIATLDDVDLAVDCGIEFIRIGVNVEDVDKAEKFIEKAKKNNLYTAVNFMKSYVASPHDFSHLVGQAQKMGADTCYLVDSAGNMTPRRVQQYFEAVKERNTIGLSFHGHDNLGLATANALMAFECGAEFIDVSLQGMGRSSGNTPSENFISLLDRLGIHHRFDLIDMMDIAEELIRPKLSTVGLDTVDIVCGLAGFHSSYMNIIREFAIKFDIDPRKLIISVSKENQLEAPRELVERKARLLKEIAENTGWKHRFPLDRYFGNEQSIS
jgi:4-hydroxy-2-oxovalerate aldolase